MTAKQYLNQARRIDKEIDVLHQRVEETRERLESITQNYDGDGAQSTKDPHKFDRLLELESLVEEKINEQIAMKAEILSTISKLKDRQQRLVLTLYYTGTDKLTKKPLTWEQVAVEMDYSFQHTMRMHGYALNEIEKLLKMR